MYKLLFNLVTDPINLPIPLLYEYIILLIINEIACQIAWKASPGGFGGSTIHWIVRFIFFVVTVTFLNLIIFVVKWILANLVLFASIVIALGVIYLGLFYYIKRIRKKNEV